MTTTNDTWKTLSEPAHKDCENCKFYGGLMLKHCEEMYECRGYYRLIDKMFAPKIKMDDRGSVDNWEWNNEK